MTQLSLVMSHERKHRPSARVAAKAPPPGRRRHADPAAEPAPFPRARRARRRGRARRGDDDRLRRRPACSAINELLGHPTGDEALRQIGTALRETLRRRDVAGRLGGDEFAVVLPRTRLADSTIVVSRIISRLDDRQVAPRIARVSLNVGSVQMIPNETIGDALRRAEAELVAKRDEARRGETSPCSGPRRSPRNMTLAPRTTAMPTPSALMSLIPVGEVRIKAGRRADAPRCAQRRGATRPRRR